DIMDVGATDQMLEIGCGGGTAAWLVSRRATRGKIIAIDKAPVMARRGQRGDAELIEAGSGEVRCGGLGTAELPAAGAGKIFAVNLSLFWMGDASAHIEKLKRLLAPRGRLFLFSERPTFSSVEAIAARIEAQLRSHGLATVRTLAAGTGGHALACVMAALPR